MRNKNKVITFFILFFVGVIFGGWGMFIPPTGAIDGSVLIFIAQIFILAASVYGFEIHFDLKEGKFDAGQKKDPENS